MATEELIYLVALHQFPKFGPARIKRLRAAFPSCRDAFSANLADLIRAGLEPNIAQEFTAARLAIDPAAVYGAYGKEGINFVVFEDENYPHLLKEIYDPPPLLYYRGEMIGAETAMAVVGTRKFTSYGRQVTENIVAELAKNNLTITSGLALGIDAIAHQTTLDNRGRTIAVLGTGLDRAGIYPAAHRYLADKIVANGGTVLTEFPIGTPPLKFNFPLRNRIIAGLSVGTLVIEAGEKSGALITARAALDQNREVFAVPGNIYSPASVGPNNLIKQGAKAVTSGREILETLDLAQITNYIEIKKIMPESKEEEMIIANLSHDPRHVDELIRLTGLNTSQATGTLTLMEMKGIVKNVGGMQYVLAH